MVDLLEAKVMFGAIEEEVVVVPTGAEAAMVVLVDVTAEDEVLVAVVVEFEIGLETMGTAVAVDVVKDEVAVAAYAVSDEFVIDVVEDEFEVTVADVVVDEVAVVCDWVLEAG